MSCVFHLLGGSGREVESASSVFQEERSSPELGLSCLGGEFVGQEFPGDISNYFVFL